MKLLIIVRHGKYHSGPPSGDPLTQEGRQNVQTTGLKLLRYLKGKRPSLITSNVLRARESADILGNIFGVEVTESVFLFSDHDTEIPMDDLVNLVNRRFESRSAVVLVTHLEITRDLPPIIAKQAGFEVEEHFIEPGHARVIDLENQTSTLISPHAERF